MPGNNAFVPVEVGFIVDVTIPNPGANTEFTYTFPDGYMYKLDLFYFLYTADVNAANRVIFLDMVDAGANYRFYGGPGHTITAGQTIHVTGIKSLARETFATIYSFFTLPNNWIPGGWTFRSDTIAMQAGDTYTNLRFTAARYREQN